MSQTDGHPSKSSPDNMESVPRLNPDTADREVMILHEEGKPVEEIVKHFRLTRTSRGDYTPEMVINQDTDGKVNTNCHRCYRLKKKCSRDFPKCEYCVKTNHDCFYVDRRKARFNYNSSYLTYEFSETKSKESDSKATMNEETVAAVGINPTSCSQCFRLKRKCSRTFPRCDHCSKTNKDCTYDKNKRYRALKFDQLVRAALEKDDSGFGHSERTPIVATPDNTMSPTTAPIPTATASTTSLIPTHGAHDVSSSSMALSSEASAETDGIGSEVVFKKIDSDDQSTNKIVKKSLGKVETEEEFVNLKSFDDPSLPTTFIDNFFYNYEFIYPLFDKDEINEELKSYNFNVEQIINSKLYLLLSIGCLITDTISQESRFNKYFNENIIDSIIDSIEFSSFDSGSFSLLVLLTIYYVHKKNFLVTWNIVGVIIRLVIKYDLYREPSPALISIYNLDKELSSILNKPSQFPQDNHCALVSDIPLVNKFHELYRLENRINSFKLDTVAANSDDYSSRRLALSNEVEAWRVGISGALHTNLHSPRLQEFTTLVNLNYYYLSIELDELSSLKSSQFILQFLSQYFALILSDKQKSSIGVSLDNLFYFEKLIKVIKFNVANLSRANNAGYIENFQLILNLLKFLNNKTDLKKLIDVCTSLNDEIRGPKNPAALKSLNDQVMAELKCVSSV